MKLATLLLSGTIALGALGSADVLAHDKGRGYDRDDRPRHEVQRHKHIHHYYAPRRHYDRGHGKHHWKRDHKAYRYDYRPYRYDYRYKPRYRDSAYGIHLFFGG